MKQVTNPDMFKFLKTWTYAAFLLLVASGAYAASEQVIAFESRMTVHADATITVIETIDVVATGANIKRGIYREFPTSYKDRLGNTVQTGFDVLGVRRGGQAIDFWIENKPGSQRVYMGNRGAMIDPGRHLFELTYKTDHQIGYFEDFDEIYWNATGNLWDFPIQKAVAIVRLPTGAKVLQHAAYTGPQGSTDQNFTTSFEPDGSPRFTTTRPLASGEGLTVAVAWPKGFVSELPGSKNAIPVLDRSTQLVFAVIGFLATLVYLYFAWLKIGRDPRKGPIVARPHPPVGFSPAATNYIFQMGFNDTTFASAIISLAIKGNIKIEDNSDSYSLSISSPEMADVSPGEKALFKTLFTFGTQVQLDNTNHKIIGGARNALRRVLDRELQDILFKANRKYLIPGFVLSVLSALWIAMTSEATEVVVFMTFWLSVWVVGCSLLVKRALMTWHKAVQSMFNLVPAIAATVIAGAFLCGLFYGLGELASVTSYPIAALMIATFALTPLFHNWMKAPTFKGQAIMDQIEGFKLYLSQAEQQVLQHDQPSEDTPDLFETLLPYAFALGGERSWCERFTSHLAKAGSDQSARAYQPTWYTGDVSSLGRTLDHSFTNALSSSSQAPNNNSGGSGGGGSSGGGSGGGGGGGF